MVTKTYEVRVVDARHPDRRDLPRTQTEARNTNEAWHEFRTAHADHLNALGYYLNVIVVPARTIAEGRWRVPAGQRFVYAVPAFDLPDTFGSLP